MICTMYSYSTSPHVSQLYTGFSILRMNGQINLEQESSNYCHKGERIMKHLEPEALNGLFVTLNKEKVIFYDTSDGPCLNEEALEVADAYFKRSYLSEAIPDRYRFRVFPLGLNYEVYTGKLDYYEFARMLLRKNLVGGRSVEWMRWIAGFASITFLPTVHNMCSPPKPDQEPRVLFMARAWDPNDVPPGLPAEIKEEHMHINNMRAHCIQLLRKELGKRFYGGFAHNSYAVANYRELLLEDATISRKKMYISLLHQYPICIATTGLQGSIGWKMGEYVAFSKSIVSERLNFSVPGIFERNRNYLEFNTPELCLQQTVRLIESKHLRQQMMEDNWHYYQTHLAPDKLILRTLNIVRNIS